MLTAASAREWRSPVTQLKNPLDRVPKIPNSANHQRAPPKTVSEAHPSWPFLGLRQASCGLEVLHRGFDTTANLRLGFITATTPLGRTSTDA